MARLVAVDFDPFDSGGTRLTPVDFDPFADQPQKSRTSFFREPVSVGGRVGVGGEPVLNSVGATGEARLRLDEEPPAEETPEQARLKRDSAWIDETMRQFTSREGIDALHAEARAAGVPLGRAVRWKRNQLERQAKAGSLQPPETPSLSMADVNEQSTRERAGAIEFADQLRGRIGQWPNTGEGEDPELFSALEVIEQYRKQVAPEVPGPRFMRQLFPREMAQQQERDPNGSWSAAGESLLQSIKQTAAGGAQALGERLRYAGNYIPAVRGLLDTPANFLRTEGYEQGAEALARMNELGAQMAPRPTASVYDDPEGWARYFGQQGVASSGLTLAGMGASLVNPALGAATFLGGAGGSEYGRARIEDGASPSEAGVRALTSAATEGIPEMLGGAAMLGRLPLMGLAQSTARGRAAIAIPTEAGTEGLTEKLNIEAERARGKYISPEEESARIKDAVVIGGMLGGGIGTGSAAIESGARSLQDVYEFSGQAADLTRQAQARATTDRILGRTTPPQTPQEAQTDAGAGIAEAAIQNALAARPVPAPISPVATNDMRENDELDRLLVGALGGVEDGQAVSDQLRPNGDTQAGVRSAVSSVPVDLPDGTYFIPGDPAAIRQRLADAGVEWRGMERTIDGQTGVRFGADTRGQVLGVLGGSLDTSAGIGAQALGVSDRETSGRGATSGNRNEQLGPSSGGGLLARRADGTGKAEFDVVPMDGAATNAGSLPPATPTQPTQAEAAVDGRDNRTGNLAPSPTSGRNDAAGVLGDAAGRAPAEQGAAHAATPDVSPETRAARAGIPRQAEAAVDVAPPKPRNYRDTQFDERKHDLLDFIAMNGGLDRAAAESEGVDPAVWKAKSAENDRFFGKPAFKKGGMSIETLREKLAQSNFAPIAQNRDALDLVFDALGGREVVTPDGATWRQQQRERDENERIQRALSDLPASMRSAAEQAQMQSAIPDGDVESLALAQQAERDQVRDDILSALPSVQDQSPAQRVSAQSLGADYTDRLLSLMGARKSGAMTEAERDEYTALLEQDRETGKVNGRPMVGVGNKTGYVDALSQGRLRPVQVFTDADQFKLVNDKFGHDVGDEVIRLYGSAMIAEFGQGRVWHRGGDEFLADAETDAEADAAMARVAERMRNIRLEVPLSDGRTAVLEGIGVSYGKGATEKDADEGLKRDKERRKRLGLRADRQDADSRSVDSQPDGAGSQAGRADSRRGDATQAGAAAEGGVGEDRAVRSPSIDGGRGSRPGATDGRGSDSPMGRQAAGPVDGDGRVGLEAGRGAEPVRSGGTDGRGSPDGDARSGNANASGRAGSVSAAGDRADGGSRIGAVRSAVSRALGSKFLRRLESQPWFNLVESLDQLPPDVRKSISGDDIAGFVLPDGRVFIIAENVGDNATGIVLHEVGVHFGMSGLPDFPAMLAQFKRMRPRDGAVARAYESVPKDTPADLIDEEAFAYYVEQNWNAKTPLMTRIKDAIARLLNRLGVPTSGITDALMRQALDGMVQSAREAADKATRGLVTVRDGKVVYHKAWHGSPHDFDKFRLDDSTIGTGEGAQAYGHGLYFAGKRELADWYKVQLSGRTITGVDGSRYGASQKEAEADARRLLLMMRASPKEFAAYDDGGQSYIGKIVRDIKRGKIKADEGRLYEVELAPDESDYLDWDAPLSEQSEKVRDALAPLVDWMLTRPISDSAKTAIRDGVIKGAAFYKQLAGEKSLSQRQAIGNPDILASNELRDAGVPGIRYLDGSSRGKGDGSRNYVLFDDSLVKVQAKYSFAGRNAKTANIGTLEQAQAMIADGASAEDARKATGWFKGRDGKWRFEIDDSGARLTDSAWERIVDEDGNNSIRLGDAISHDALFAAYPAIKNYGVIFTDGGLGAASGNFSDGVITIERGQSNPLSTILHEIQHGIQEVEGFAKGGSPQSESSSASERLAKAGVALSDEVMSATNRNEILSDVRGAGLRFSPIQFGLGVKSFEMQEVADFLLDIAKRFGNTRLADAARNYIVESENAGVNPVTNAENEGFDAYRRLSGETEARNVQTRQRMTAAERRGTSPQSTQDVPDERQVVRYSRRADGGSVGGMADTINVNGVDRPTVNSTGAPIADSEDGVRAFWEWFGNSRVVDEDGRPIVVYHGTNADFDVFDMSRGGANWDDDASRAGVFFSNDKDDADHFASIAANNGGAPTRFKGYLALKSPMSINDGTLSDFVDEWLENLEESDPKEYEAQVITRAWENSGGIHKGLELAIVYARRRGMDGAIIDVDSPTGSRWFAAFSPDAIRSTKSFKSTRQAPPREGLGASGDRIAYSRRTRERPLGLDDAPELTRSIADLWNSASDVLRKVPTLRPLATAIDAYFDSVRRRLGQANGILRPAIKASTKEDQNAFERYQEMMQRGDFADARAELAEMTPEGRALVEAWDKVAKLTGDQNDSVGVKVFDARTNAWRPIGRVRNFWPRRLKRQFRDAMRSPHKYPADWNLLVNILLDSGRITDVSEAREYLNNYFAEDSANDYFAGIERARSEPLPLSLYDYSLDTAVNYKDRWADRISQIEHFGQKTGPNSEDLFDKLKKAVTDERTQRYIGRVQDSVEQRKLHGLYDRMMLTMRTIATGLMLGNPATASLNIIGGLSMNQMVFPMDANLRASARLLTRYGESLREAIEVGALVDDYYALATDALRAGLNERLANFTQGALKIGGYSATEFINRTHAFLAGKYFLQGGLAAINRNARSRKSKLTRAFLQRNGFDVERLLAEQAEETKPETERWLRYATNLTQFSYNIDQTPVFIDEPTGKFLFQFQKFGTQMNRLLWQQILKPFFQSVFKGGEPYTIKDADGREAQERVRNFWPVVRFFAAAVPGGLLVQAVRQLLFGYGEDGPDEDELRRKLANGQYAAAVAMAAEKAGLAVIALGALGFIGNYAQMARDVTEQQRVKNPLEPPGTAVIQSVGQLVLNIASQGELTLHDVDKFIEQNVSFYRTSKRLGGTFGEWAGSDADFVRLESARREFNHARYMARRYADQVGIEARRTATGDFLPTERSPTTRAVREALLMGNPESARAIAYEYLKTLDSEKEVDNALASIKAAIRAGQPSLVPGAPSDRERRSFLRWAEANLTREGYLRIKGLDDAYRSAADRSGLWSPREVSARSEATADGKERTRSAAEIERYVKGKVR